jgi:hypothetical protein
VAVEDAAQGLGAAQAAAFGHHLQGVVARLEVGARRVKPDRSTNRPGLWPTSVVNTRVKWRTLMDAAPASAASRWSPPGADSTRS